MDSTELIRSLVSLPAPPGEETEVRVWLDGQARSLGYVPSADAKGNLAVTISGSKPGPGVVVTAHMDEIALMITRVDPDGKIRVAAIGGAYTWKWGEGPVEILAGPTPLVAILSYGGIHTNAPESVAQQARERPLDWKQAYLFTGLTPEMLTAAGIRPGLRVVLSRTRRIVTEFGPYVSSYFLDDRADLAVWLMALETIRTQRLTFARDVTFLATASEEVGGEGAQFYLRSHPADLCVALEIGPKTADSDVPVDAQPTIWVRDGYAAMEACDGAILSECARQLGQTPHWQYLSRGGSDASCASAVGLVARPVTLGLPVENSHGYEIMHRDAPRELARLLLAYLAAVAL